MEQSEPQPTPTTPTPEATVVVLRRTVDGKFVKGNPPGPGKPKGLENRFATIMKEQTMLWIQEQGTSANPLMIAARIARDYAAKEPSIALKAADLVCKYTMPRVTELTGKNGGPLHFADRERDVSELARDPAVRAIIEAAENQLNNENRN